MQFFPASLQNLSDQFARLPGIGGKTAQRLAFHVLEMPLEEAQAFADAILDAKRTVHTCPCCQNLTDQPLCPICADETRDHGTICVVAEPKDVIAMERSREYRGVYHVLHGVISPLNRVTQDDIKIRELMLRIGEGDVQEVIMATNPDTEGEATAILKVQQAMADSLKLLNEAAPNDQVIKLKALEALEKVADGKATKLIIPSEIQGLAGLAASAKTILSDDKPEA